ncbi:MAG: toast rack family protein [bacterium]
MSLKNLFSSIIVILLLPLIALAGKLSHEEFNIGAEKAKSIEAKIDFGAGEIIVNADDIDDVVKGEIGYEPKTVEFRHDYEVEDGVGELYLESDHKDNFDIDTEENKWDITFSTKYPMSLNMDIGACEAEMDLGGLQLQNLTFEVGASSSIIEFSRPNPVRMDKIKIDAGASSLEMKNFGNANFKYFSFDGGVGSFKLDLRGKYTDNSRVTISVGVGSMDLTLPKDIPIRVETNGAGWLSSIDFHRTDLEATDDDVYESDDYEDADIRLLVEIDVGLGSVDIYQK